MYPKVCTMLIWATHGGALGRHVRRIGVIGVFQGLGSGLEVTSPAAVVHIAVEVPPQAITTYRSQGAHTSCNGADGDYDKQVRRHRHTLRTRPVLSLHRFLWPGVAVAVETERSRVGGPSSLGSDSVMEHAS
jgi:hypothetical protein